MLSTPAPLSLNVNIHLSFSFFALIVTVVLLPAWAMALSVRFLNILYIIDGLPLIGNDCGIKLLNVIFLFFISNAVSCSICDTIVAISISSNFTISGASSSLFRVEISASRLVSRCPCAWHRSINSFLLSSLMSGLFIIVSRYPCMLATGVFSSCAMF